jgi:hypothetical protein
MASEETRGSLLATVRSDEVRLVRRKHRVGLSHHHTVYHIMEILQKLPQHATLDEWIDWNEFDVLTLEFHEESRSKGGDGE